MDTVKRSSGESSSQLYDGFISYSHAADDLLAPRLQSALQRFAKPWWKRRAVRIFRDESSLSANPQLWSSITEALDTSGWFVLLLSPDAASSEWVNQEIAYWVEHRDPRKILPVVTDGTFGWDGSDVTGDAVPDALLSVFGEEPRWVDARWAKDEDQLDLKDPRFADAIADIASTIRGIPKDDLASEEVREHRRTVRTAWIAGLALVGLTLAAIATATFAFSQRAEADRQRDLAEASEQRARESEQRALDNEQRALKQAADSEARRLSAVATTAMASDAQLAMLLALEAHFSAASDEVRGDVLDVLRQASIGNRLIGRFDVTSGLNYARISPDGSTVIHSSVIDRRLTALDLTTGSIVWQVGTELEPSQLAISPNGDHVAVRLQAPESEQSMVAVLDARTGDPVANIESGVDCNWALLPLDGFSASGRWMVAGMGQDYCDFWTTEDDWAAVYDTRGWQETARYSVDDAYEERLIISERGDLAVGTYYQNGWWAQVLTFPSLEVRSTFRIDNGRSVALSGTTLVYDVGAHLGGDYQIWPKLLDIVSGDSQTFSVGELSNTGAYFCQELDNCFEFEMFSMSPDGQRVSVVGIGRDSVVDVADTSTQIRLYKDAITYDASWTADGSTLITAHEDELLVWAIVPDGRRLERVVKSGDWVEFAYGQLQRNFSEGECVAYRVDPCPTLDEMRSR